MAFLEYRYSMPEFKPAECRRAYEEQGKDCGGECWTSSCPLSPQPVAPTARNCLALEVHALVRSIGWEGLQVMGADIEMTRRERDYVLWALGLLRAYDAALALPEREQARAVTEVLRG